MLTVAEAAERLGMREPALRQALWRYERQGLLSIARGKRGERLLTEEVLERFQQVRRQVHAGMRQRCSVVQSERMATRKLAEQQLRCRVQEVEARLRQTRTQLITGRVREILAAYPQTRTDDWELLLTYYRVFHGTENLRAARADGAPLPETITRIKREVLKEEKAKCGGQA